MASRLATLRGALKTTTQTVLKEGAKVSEYSGPSIGAGTGGTYGSLPRPMPFHFFFTQEFNLKWVGALTAVSIAVVGSFVPLWSIPFYRKAAKDLKKIDDEFGPTKYGAGKKFSI
jgi:hypothetical protein